MKYKSQIIASGSGSVAGATFSRNRFGSYVRARAIPVNPDTSQQQAIRSSFSTLASAWTNLPALDRSGWETYGINTPVIDGLGNSITLTGMNWYIACNQLRLQAGLTRVDTPPILFGMATFTIVTATLAAATDQWSVTFTNGDAWANEVGGAMVFWGSRPFSPTRTFFAGPYRFINKLLGAVVPPVSPTNQTSPFAISAGQRAGLKVRVIRADGRISPLQTLQAVAA